MRNTILGFGLLVLSILIFLTVSKFSYLMGYLKTELLIGIFSLIAFGVGVYLTSRSQKPNSNLKTDLETNLESKPQEKKPPIPTLKSIKEFNLTSRELEVLSEIGKGLTNQQIAQKLYLSESTVKTHVSSILFKLNARRRTEIILKLKEYCEFQ